MIREYFKEELYKIADSDYERIDSGARREGSQETEQPDNSASEVNKIDVKSLKRKMGKKYLRKAKKKELQLTRPMTNSNSEEEESDPEKESYSEKLSYVIRASKGSNLKINTKDLIL